MRIVLSKALVLAIICLFIGMATIPGLSINVAIKNECNTVENIDTIDKKYIASKRIESHGEYNETMNDLPRQITFLFGIIDGFYITEENGWTFFRINAIMLLVIYMEKISKFRYSYDVNFPFTYPILIGFWGFDLVETRGIWKDNFICGFIIADW